MTDKPRVSPALSSRMAALLQQKDFLFRLLDGFGSPLNLVLPQQVPENLAGFSAVYRERSLAGRVFMTHKPNRSRALVRSAAFADCGLDVSSEGELAAALAAGFHPSRIEATGPKNPGYLTLCALQDVLINVDNPAELAQVVALHSSLGRQKPLRVMARLDGFSAPGVVMGRQEGIYGFRPEDVPTLFETLAANRTALDFAGFSAHFLAATLQQKLVGIASMLEITFEAMRRGFSPRALDIGGGYPVRHADSRDEWQAFLFELKASVMGQRPSLSWGNSGLGYFVEGDSLRGTPRFSDQWADAPGPFELAALLDAPIEKLDGMSAARLLSENMLELMVEPGRASYDQCGATIARVNHTKSSMQGELLAGLDINRSNLNIHQLMVMTDPILISRGGDRKPCENGIYYFGNLCVRHEMITSRKTFPDLVPEAGDMVVFPNTAAYQMDFAESRTLQQRVAEKVAVVQGKDGVFSFVRDELYGAQP